MTEPYVSQRTFLLARMAYYQERLLLAENTAEEAEFSYRLDQVEAALEDLNELTNA